MKFKGPFRRLEDRLAASEPLTPGLYHYREGDDYEGIRLHLRVEPDGTGILSVNAQRILHLNQTATEYAKLILEGGNEDDAVQRLRSRYKVAPATVRADFQDLREKIGEFSTGEKVCPISYMDIDRMPPFKTPTTAPYRMDFALTYRCDNDCLHCYVERPRDYPEFDTSRWKKALERLWDLGIPHVVFTGGEATLRDDLVELVEYAEDIGLIAGLLTNGRNLAGGELMRSLADAGLDHVQITLESHLAEVHDGMVGCPGAWAETVAGIRAAVQSPVYTITNTTISAYNRDTILETVDFLHELGLENIAMNGIIYTGGAREGEAGVPERDMEEILFLVRERANSHGMNLVWYTPTRYCDLDPVALGLGPKQCTAAKYNMCVEPNGDVIPCQSYYTSMGNFLTDDWAGIWGNPIAEAIRRRDYADDECRDCETFELCGAGCPLSVDSETLVCIESKSSG